MSERLVKVVAAFNEPEAERMRRELLVAGIPSVVRNSDALSTMQMTPPPPFSLALYVREGDLSEALDALGLTEGPE